MSKDEASWTFFSNYGHVYFLIALSEDDLTLREISDRVGITERSVQGIIQSLEEAGYVERLKVGRNNVYKIKPGKTLRHDLESNVKLEDLTNLIRKTKKQRSKL
ncbi:MAG: winged helix-turn-helix domain-containing protein [Pseudomonadota bacterium]